ncbi:hypothetical protein EP7_002913 [Isosphaeraceae bacterium EP7]
MNEPRPVPEAQPSPPIGRVGEPSRRRRLLGIPAALILGTFISAGITSGGEPLPMTATFLLAWGSASSLFALGPLALLAHLLRSAPLFLSLAWTIPVGAISGVIFTIAAWIFVFGGWGPPPMLAPVAACVTVGIICSIAWRADVI